MARSDTGRGVCDVLVRQPSGGQWWRLVPMAPEVVVWSVADTGAQGHDIGRRDPATTKSEVISAASAAPSAPGTA